MNFVETLKSSLGKKGIAFLLICIFSFAAHGIGLRNGYTWDDRYLIPRAEEVAKNGDLSSAVKSIFQDRHLGSSGTGGSYYRPLRTTLFIIITSLPGQHALYLHSFSILLHIVVAFLIFRLSSSMSGGRLFPLLGSLSFAVHPVLTEPVANISNVKEILTMLFVMAALYYLYRIAERGEGRTRDWFIIGAVTYLALVSKETALVIPIMSIAMMMVFRKNMRVTFLFGAVPVLISTGIYLLHVLVLFPGPEKGEYILGSLWPTLYTTSAAFVKYLELILWPAGLSIRHDIPIIDSPWDLRVISVSVFFLLLIILSVFLILKKSSRAIPLVFFSVSLLPLSNIIPIIGHVMSERYLYMPLGALCLILATFRDDSLTALRAKYVVPVFLAVIIVLTARSAFRTMEWKDDRKLFESAVRIAPDSLAVRWNLHRVYHEAGEYQRAMQEFREMQRINRKIVEEYVSFALKRDAAGDREAAEKIWKRAEYSASGNAELLEYVRTQRNGE